MRRLSITVQVMLLVTLATLLASGAMALIALRGPPPRAMPWSVQDIARAITHQPYFTKGKRPLVERAPKGQPAAPDGLTADPAAARRIEHAAGLPNGSLQLFRTADARPDTDKTPAATAMQRDHIVGNFTIIQRERVVGFTVWRTGRDPELLRWQLLTGTTVAGVLAAILLLTWLIARRITRPIFDLARAARHARAGETPAFAMDGATPEVREAAQAIADLQQRNADHAQGRLTMLGAIAHDLGTPLARLAFRVASLDDAAREAGQADIAAMRAMIADSLTMARRWDGTPEPLDVAAICRSIAQAEAALGHEVAYAGPDELPCTGHPLLLQRMVQNLVDNALRYGTRARVTLERAEIGESRGGFRLAVEDDGPGFPDMPQGELLRPFVRGEASRNTATGGSGLGLAIVAQVVERHGGTIALGTARTGGALVAIAIPCSG
ncbi:MAG: hypothetical protein IE933_13635 [Sphingomonadales bacterium]|nr:hypothetical protein [Sphingomonadales bacterium]